MAIPWLLSCRLRSGKIIATIDEQIGRLEQAKKLLSGSAAGLGRTGRRTLSAAARARIAAAQRRWAKQKRAAKQG
jgi:hypothetical protein